MNSDIAIRAEHLSKMFRIGVRNHRSLRDALTDAVSLPFRLFRGRNGQGGEHGTAENAADLWALRDVSFEIKTGEVVGIIGRNGAGKSTLLKVLSRITEPTTGFADIRGRVGSLLEVGTGFHPELTGRENVFLNGAILGMSRREIARKFDAIVAFAEVDRFIDTPVKRYSSGMYVRLAFAVAAHLEPEILIVDEVLAVGDMGFQKKCLGKMGDIGREGRTVLLVSHNMPSIVNLCARAVLLDGGRTVADGPAAMVVQEYLAASRSDEGEMIWPDPEEAPGNDLGRLHAVRVLQDGLDGATADVDIAKDIRIEIDYWCLKEGTQLYPAVHLKDNMGTLVLASHNARGATLGEDPWYGKPYPCGLFRTVCVIPGNFLNDSRYVVSVILGKLYQIEVARADSVVSFLVHDTGSMREESYANWSGWVVRPRLAWQTEFVGKEAPVACVAPAANGAG